MSLIPLVAVVGPTASGKTRLAVDIAIRYGGEVVSADSMQIYKGMSVGTAKPTASEMRGVPHHMIDMVNPRTVYSVAQYVEDARRVIAEINSRGWLPVVAGGTGLYIDSLIENVKFSKTSRDEKLRERLMETAQKEGGEALLKILAEFDPQTASSLHPNNTGRIIRAIEVYKTSGKTMTQLKKESRIAPPLYKTCMIGLCFADRSELYSRIDKRVDKMMDDGLEQEVRSLLAEGIDSSTTAMQAIGYKEIAEAVEGKLSLKEAVEKVKLSTRHYAKRQMTWFRRNTRINWIEAGQLYENICQKAFEIIDNCDLL